MVLQLPSREIPRKCYQLTSHIYMCIAIMFFLQQLANASLTSHIYMCIAIANIYNFQDVHAAFVHAVSTKLNSFVTLPRVVTYFIRAIVSAQTRFEGAKPPLESANVTVFLCSLNIRTFYNFINISD